MLIIPVPISDRFFQSNFHTQAPSIHLAISSTTMLLDGGLVCDIGNVVTSERSSRNLILLSRFGD